MKCNELISLIIPVFNVERYIEKCIDSVVNQSYKHIEIILIDDGSTDSSGDLCDKFAKMDSRIIVVHKANGGLSSARNIGIDISHGEWISFIDSDDYVAEDYILDLYYACKKYSALISTCGRYDVYEKQVIENYNSNEPILCNRKDALKCLMQEKVFNVAAWGKLYKRTIFNNIRYPINELSEDVAVIFDIIMQVNKIVHCGASSYFYVHRKNSITTKIFSDKKRSALKNYIKLYKDIISFDKESQKDANIFLIKYLMSLINGYNYKALKFECDERDNIFLEEIYSIYKGLYKECIFNWKLSFYEKILGFLYYIKKYQFVKRIVVKLGFTHKPEE